MRGVVSGAKNGAKLLALRSGGLPAYHRLRNGEHLTVLCFHRVLTLDDPRWPEADRDWTVSVEQFADTVRFAKRHYNVVSLEEVLHARRRRSALPSRPLLLTFDDGWADNEEYALPILEAERVPAVVFISGDAVDRAAPFWREALRTAFQGNRLDASTWRALWSDETAPAIDEAGLEALITRLAKRRRVERDGILSPLAERIHDERRHMLTEAQIRRLRAKGIAIGAHGRTHEPLDACEDLDDELAQPRARLGEILGEPVTTLALPHSRFTPEVLRRAAHAGYELVFSGEQQLAPSRPLPFAIGRVPITPGAVSDDARVFRPERLALNLFRKRHLSAWA